MYLLSYRSKTNFVQISEGCSGFQSSSGIIDIHFKGSGCQDSESLRVKILVKSEAVAASAQNLIVLSLSVVSKSLRPRGVQSAKTSLPWDFPGKDTGVGWRFLLQEFFPTQISNPHLLHWQGNSLSLRHLGSPSSACAVPGRAMCQFISGLGGFVKDHPCRYTMIMQIYILTTNSNLAEILPFYNLISF